MATDDEDGGEFAAWVARVLTLPADHPEVIALRRAWADVDGLDEPRKCVDCAGPRVRS